MVLTEVILSAISQDAYAAASEDPAMLEDWLLDGDIILREGATYTYPGDVSVQGNSSSTLADRKSTRLNSSHSGESRMPSSA